MPYHTPLLICGCGTIFPLHDFIKEKDASMDFMCKVCGSTFEIVIHVPKDVLINDAVQRADFEKIHGKVE